MYSSIGLYHTSRGLVNLSTLDICVRKSSADDHNQYYHYEKESAPIHNYAIGMRYIGLSPSASSQ